MSGRSLAGKYTIERELAQGEKSTLWVAYDRRLQRRVALKRMHNDGPASALARVAFEREATAIARLQHPNIVQIFDYGIHGGEPYLIMELLEGETLSARLTSERPLGLTAAIKLIVQVAKGLSAAHAAGIAHGNLKPSHVFITSRDGEEVVKLLDFSVPSLLGEGQAEAPDAAPLRYRRPEPEATPPHAGPPSDLWALSVIAYEALTGELPFNGASPDELSARIRDGEHSPPSRLVSELGPEVDSFFRRAFAKHPAERFQTALDFAAALAALDSPARPKRREKILFVDDEPDVTVLIKHRLRQLVRSGSFELVFAHNGLHALKQIQRHPDISVVLTDINMPEMDGLTLLQELRERHPLITVIIVSAYKDMKNLRTAMNRGAFDFLVKPLDFKDLEATISKAIRHAQVLHESLRFTEENSVLRLFVDSEALSRLLGTLRAVDMGPSESVQATIVSIEVHDFASTIAGMHPQMITRRLSANLEIIVSGVNANQGVVDRFIGSGLLAVFRGKDNLERALASCLSIRNHLGSLAERAGPDSAYAYGISAGICSGDLVSGDVGSVAHLRVDHALLGAPVSVAAHLRSLAAKSQLLVADPVPPEIVDAFILEPLGAVRLPSQEAPAAMYNVVGKRQRTASQAGSHDDQTSTAACPPEKSP